MPSSVGKIKKDPSVVVLGAKKRDKSRQEDHPEILTHHSFPIPRRVISSPIHIIFFFFNDTATTEIYTLSLHDALPISLWSRGNRRRASAAGTVRAAGWAPSTLADRKSTRLNSSHVKISYAVFCLK